MELKKLRKTKTQNAASELCLAAGDGGVGTSPSGLRGPSPPPFPHASGPAQRTSGCCYFRFRVAAGVGPVPASAPRKMADLEAVLADVSYLMAMEKSRAAPAARASKRILLPEPR